MKLVTAVLAVFIAGPFTIWAGEMVRVPIIAGSGVTPLVFELEMTDGDIEIRASEDGNYYWEAEPNSDEWDNFVQKVENKDLDDNRIRLRFGGHHDVDFVVARVPPNTMARIRLKDGDVVVKGLVQEVDINVVDGDVELVDMGGSMTVSTVDGDIDVSLKEVYQPDGQVSLASIDGDIAIRIFADIGASAKMNSLDGHIEVADVFHSGENQGKHSDWKDHGLGRNIKFKWGDGRVKIKAHTIDGDIALIAR